MRSRLEAGCLTRRLHVGIHLYDPHPLAIIDPLPLLQTVFSLLSLLLVHASPFHSKPCPANFRLLPTPTLHPKSGPEPSGTLPSALLCFQQTRKSLKACRRARQTSETRSTKGTRRERSRQSVRPPTPDSFRRPIHLMLC